MDNRHNAVLYQISVHGAMGKGCLSGFPALNSRTHDGVTALFGHLPDQSALFGVLDQVQSLGLELLGIRRVS